MRPSAHRALPFTEWPQADRAMWEALLRTGDVFDGRGPLAHLRPATQAIHRKNYGFWLGFLTDRRVDLLVTDPRGRAEPDRLRLFHADCISLASSTRHQRLNSLLQILQAAAPASDWSILRKGVNRLQRMAKTEKDSRHERRNRTISADLVQLGLDLINRAALVNDDDQGWPILHRDGVMVLMLAHHPLRSRNFGALELGRTLLRHGQDFIVCLPAVETKNHRPIEFAVAPAVAVHLARYIDTTRAKLLLKSDSDTSKVWLTKDGTACQPRKLSERIATVTKRELDIALNTHAFRHIGATTLATSSPEQARLARPFLGHADYATTERYYIHARQLEAHREWNRVLQQHGEEGCNVAAQMYRVV